MKKIILHIGTEKTGTTSIQRALAHERDNLAARGILFPHLFGSENHMEIAVYAMDSEINDELRQIELAKADCGLDEYRTRLTAQLQSEIAAGDFDTLLLSNEHCHSRLHRPGSLERLKAFLDPISPDIEIVVYLRRQDKLAVSAHSTRVKLGGQGDMLPVIKEGGYRPYFDYDGLLRRYENVFGRDAITVRLFEPDLLVGRDVVTDFFHITDLGIPVPSLAKANKSLSAKQSLFLERFNEIFPLFVDGKISQARGPIFRVVSNLLQGPPVRPVRARAEAFYGNFHNSNQAVKQRYFPDLDRETLFDEGFVGYPETEDEISLTTDDMFEVVTALWRHGHPPARNW